MLPICPPCNAQPCNDPQPLFTSHYSIKDLPHTRAVKKFTFCENFRSDIWKVSLFFQDQPHCGQPCPVSHIVKSQSIPSAYQILESTAARSIGRPFMYLSMNMLKPSTPSGFGFRVLPWFPANTFVSRKSSRVSFSSLLTR